MLTTEAAATAYGCGRVAYRAGLRVAEYQFGLENDMRKAVWPTLAAVGFALFVTTTLVNAQETVRVRGTIDRMEGPAYIVKARDGSELKVSLANNGGVTAVVKASLSDIKKGSFVGIASMPQVDGGQRALEVLIFPEAMRGVGEGHYSWDLRPQSMMTNGNVEQTVTDVNGQTLTLKYKEGEKKITVPPDAPIVAFAPGDKGDLKPGVKIFIVAAKKQADGSLETPRIAYGKDGITPPM
jgi:hypothetical protein